MGQQPQAAKPQWPGVGGVVKAGWQAHCHNPEDHGLLWPYIPPRYPLPTHLFFEEVEIHCRDQETK